MLMLGTQSGCVKTAPSTAQENNFPKVVVFTVEEVSPYSCVFAPSRNKSLWWVKTPARSVTATVADAEFAELATVVAVTPCVPAGEGGGEAPVALLVPTL